MADARENPQEAQRRSDETESRSIEETKGRTSDLSPDARKRKIEDDGAHRQENLQKQRPIPSSDKSREKMKVYKRRIAQSSVKDCPYYPFGLCLYGSECRYDHPKEVPEKTGMPICKLVEKLADAIETGTRDQNSDAMVAELKSQFDKSQQQLNLISGSLGSKTMTVDGEKQKLEESKQLLQQRRELIVEYRKSIEDILKTKP